MSIDDCAQKLTPEQFSLYKQAVNEEGAPRFLHKDNRPNEALQIIWNLRKEYGLGLRYMVEVTDDGVIRYDI